MTETKIPKSIGFILDGNRRWAKEHGLPSLEGHRRGGEKVKQLAEWAHARGIGELIVYAFSTENWNRSPEEVDYLMKLIESSIEDWSNDARSRDGALRFIGQRERLPESLQKKITEIEAKNPKEPKHTLAVALSYGGRAEILDAVNTLLAKEEYEQVTEEELRGAMWSKGLHDPDLIIRTSGEKRLSNFLTWQSVYSELFFTGTKFPDFSEGEFDAILAEYAARERRHGK